MRQCQLLTALEGDELVSILYRNSRLVAKSRFGFSGRHIKAY